MTYGPIGPSLGAATGPAFFIPGIPPIVGDRSVRTLVVCPAPPTPPPATGSSTRPASSSTRAASARRDGRDRDRAGCGKNVLYRHFPSKDELVLAYLRRFAGQLDGAMDDAVEGLDEIPRAALVAIVREVADWVDARGYRGCPFRNYLREMRDPTDAPGGSRWPRSVPCASGSTASSPSSTSTSGPAGRPGLAGDRGDVRQRALRRPHGGRDDRGRSRAGAARRGLRTGVGWLVGDHDLLQGPPVAVGVGEVDERPHAGPRRPRDAASAPGGGRASGIGEVLYADRNRVKDGDQTRHPDFDIARWAASTCRPAERAACTVYTSGEHCPMCSAAARLGRPRPDRVRRLGRPARRLADRMGRAARPGHADVRSSRSPPAYPSTGRRRARGRGAGAARGAARHGVLSPSANSARTSRSGACPSRSRSARPRGVQGSLEGVQHCQPEVGRRLGVHGEHSMNGHGSRETVRRSRAAGPARLTGYNRRRCICHGPGPIRTRHVPGRSSSPDGPEPTVRGLE